MKRLVFIFLALLLNQDIYTFQFQDVGANNLGAGSSKSALIDDPSATILNPSALYITKGDLNIYYEASSLIRVGDIIDLGNRIVIFDPATVGVSLRFEHIVGGLIFSKYLYDFYYPETIFKILSLGISSAFLDILRFGISVGPVIGLNKFETLFSFLLAVGSSVRIGNLSTYFVFRSPFSVQFTQNPNYVSLLKTFPGIISTGISYFLNDFLLFSLSGEYVILPFYSIVTENSFETAQADFWDSLRLMCGFTFYEKSSGLELSFGFIKDEIFLLLNVIPQYYLTLGASFYIILEFFKDDIKVNFSIKDGVIFNLIRIAPQNFRTISGLVSVYMKL